VIARPGCFRMQPHQTSNPKAPCDENKCSEEVRGLGTLEQVERLRARLVWLQPGAGKRGGGVERTMASDWSYRKSVGGRVNLVRVAGHLPVRHHLPWVPLPPFESWKGHSCQGFGTPKLHGLIRFHLVEMQVIFFDTWEVCILLQTQFINPPSCLMLPGWPLSGSVPVECHDSPLRWKYPGSLGPEPLKQPQP
jgi:hypothetical protein